MLNTKAALAGVGSIVVREWVRTEESSESSVHGGLVRAWVIHLFFDLEHCIPVIVVI